MHRTKIEDLVPFYLEIENTCKRGRKERKQAMTQNIANNVEKVLQNQPEVSNANNKALVDLAIPQFDGFNLIIVRRDMLASVSGSI